MKILLKFKSEIQDSRKKLSQVVIEHNGEAVKTSPIIEFLFLLVFRTSKEFISALLNIIRMKNHTF